MKIVTACENCKVSFHIDHEYVGKSVPCAACRKPFVVHASAPPNAQELLPGTKSLFKRNAKYALVGAVIAMAAIGSLSFVVFFISHGIKASNLAAEKLEKERQIQAEIKLRFSAAKEAVRKNLKYPLDAIFMDDQEFMPDTKAGIITGTVRLKNGYGAYHTHKYFVDVFWSEKREAFVGGTLGVVFEPPAS